MSDPKPNEKPNEKQETAASSKKVKIVLQRPILVNVKKNKMECLEGTILTPNAKGEPVEVTEEEAAMACDEQFTGHLSFTGERYHDSSKHDYRRARRF